MGDSRSHQRRHQGGASTFRDVALSYLKYFGSPAIVASILARMLCYPTGNTALAPPAGPPTQIMVHNTPPRRAATRERRRDLLRRSTHLTHLYIQTTIIRTA